MSFMFLWCNNNKTKEISSLKTEIEELRKEEENLIAKNEFLKKDVYNTGIKYENLVDSPNSYNAIKVKFYGKVIDLWDLSTGLEELEETKINNSEKVILSVNSDKDKLIFADVKYDVIPSRMFEYKEDWISDQVWNWIINDENITIYGVVNGVYEYNSKFIPAITVDIIEFEQKSVLVD